MDLIEMRRKLIMGTPYTIGGIPVLIDNAYTPRRNGTINDFIVNNNWFIAGWFDTVATGNKTYKYLRQASYDLGSTANGSSIRLYNDITGTSIDWWAASAGNADSEVTLTTAGQFITFSIYKGDAQNCYMYLTANNQFLFKGKSVS